MSQHDDGVRLRHMLDAARQAVGFARGRTRADLDRDLQLSLALTRLVEIVGEAAKNVSTERRALLPKVPWRAIAGTRDRLVHAYFDVDHDQLWQIVSTDLPALQGARAGDRRLAINGDRHRAAQARPATVTTPQRHCARCSMKDVPS